MTATNPDLPPTPGDPTGPCPWCGRVSNFRHHNGADLAQTDGITTHAAAIMACQGCNRSTVVITDRMGAGILWYPTPGMGLLDSQVNRGVASAYDEGVRCLSIGANRAAVVMFRSALSLFVRDKGNAEAKAERHLKSALKHMKDDNSLHPSLWDWADHLNQLGNEGAHPEDYDDVTAEEAATLGEFVRHLIRNEYEMPAQLLRARGLLVEDETRE